MRPARKQNKPAADRLLRGTETYTQRAILGSQSSQRLVHFPSVVTLASAPRGSRITGLDGSEYGASDQPERRSGGVPVCP